MLNHTGWLLNKHVFIPMVAVEACGWLSRCCLRPSTAIDKHFPMIPMMATGNAIQTALMRRVAGIAEATDDSAVVTATATAAADDGDEDDDDDKV